MKKLLYLSLAVLLLFSCSKEEKKLEMFSPEAFAYSMDDGWELNASARIKGFELKEDSDLFETNISYSVDLVKTDGDTAKNVLTGELKNKELEIAADLQINAQIELDSTYTPGSYGIVFRAIDNFSGRTASVKAKFDLTKD